MESNLPESEREAQESLEREISGILTLIASGVYHLSCQPRISDPPDLLNGLASLSHFAHEHGITELTDPSDYYNLCNTPLKNWGLPMLPPGTDPESVFIAFDEISEDCLVLAKPAVEGIVDVEAEMTENIILDIREACRQLRNSEAYVHCRKFLIEHPICTQGELEGLTSILPGKSLPGLLASAYEDVPTSFIVNGGIDTCPHCQWTIRWTEDRRPFCVTTRCNSVIQTNSHVGTVRVSGQGRPLRLKRGLQMYVGVPGLSEFKLVNGLTRIKGLEVELWPEFDAYDLRVTFTGTKEVWAIEVKDYRNPTRLAKEVKPFKSEPPWDRAFYAFPEHRRSRGYMQTFRNLCPGHASHTEAVFFRDLIRIARELVQEAR